MASKAERPKVPKFENEAEEARWWDEHKAMVEESLMQAMRDGTAQRGTAQRTGKGGARVKGHHHPDAYCRY